MENFIKILFIILLVGFLIQGISKMVQESHKKITEQENTCFELMKKHNVVYSYYVYEPYRMDYNIFWIWENGSVVKKIGLGECEVYFKSLK